jgi:type II secretory pathway pseudopilin PulG
MNTFIKDNWFKIGILVVLVIIALSTAYYFVIFVPQKEKARIEQAKQEQLSSQLKEQQDNKNTQLNMTLLDDCLARAQNEHDDIDQLIYTKVNDGGFNDFPNAGEAIKMIASDADRKLQTDKDECFKKYPQK